MAGQRSSGAATARGNPSERDTSPPMLLLLLACVSDPPAPAATPDPVPPRCGDGVVDPDEACDDGAANGDAADQCRATCNLPACGDAVVDTDEVCDDGALRGGDGCDGSCAAETGALEVEPNDTIEEATVASDRVHGALDDGDVDCWSVELAQCEAIAVAQTAPCDVAMTFSLYNPDGALVAVGAPGESGCAALDPADQPGARWVGEGTWTVCAEPVTGALASYGLVFATSASTDFDGGDDLDADGAPDSCDLDRDGDGVADADDNCPDVSNGPDTTLTLDASGYVRTWLGAGPFTGGVSTGGCRPAEDARVGEDLSEFGPALGDPAGETIWRAHLLDSGLLNLLDFYGTVDAPREAYALVYLQSEAAVSATLAVGADDGVFAWWNGTQVLDIADCQGVNADQFQAPVDVLAGTNTLLLKVYDQGGGWGLIARLLDAEGAAILDLTPALDPEGTWRPDQTDSDGDGLGDVCDE
jgi:cysteine-rich repeat protein